MEDETQHVEQRERKVRRCPDGCTFNDVDAECLNCANTDRFYAKAEPPERDGLKEQLAAKDAVIEKLVGALWEITGDAAAFNSIRESIMTRCFAALELAADAAKEDAK